MTCAYEKITIDDLHAFLVENKDKIDYVNLEWRWSPHYLDCSTNYVVDGGPYDGYPVFARFSASNIDREYCYSGDIEGAIEFAKSYDCWDGNEFELHGGCILQGVEDAYNVNEDYPDDESDLGDMNWRDLLFDYFGIYSRKDDKLSYYDGPMRREVYE